MVNLEDIRRFAVSLPETTVELNERGQFRAEVAAKGFAWTWAERVITGKPRVPRPEVLAIRVSDLQEKEALLASDKKKFFTEPHYNGFPAVLVRLSEVDEDELTELLTDAWRSKAPRKLLKELGL